MTQLNKQEYRALLALRDISCGGRSFLNVLDADELVEKGLADRLGKGQYILTDAGLEYLEKFR